MQAPSHLSIEIDHFYPEDLARGHDYIQERFQQAGIWAVAAAAAEQRRTPDAPISTCVMVDDYEKLRDQTPQEVIGGLVLPAAAAAGVRIDYIGLEGGCARLADTFLDTLTDGSLANDRPLVQKSGWLAKGTPGNALQKNMAMDAEPKPDPRHRGSIFIDVELFSRRPDGSREWACPYLASIWQGMRLGAIDSSHGYAGPQLIPHDQSGAPQFGDDWDALPIIMQLQPDAQPFAAYRACSILPVRYMAVESAVNSILRQSSIGTSALSAAMHEHAAQEERQLPASLPLRMERMFVAVV